MQGLGTSAAERQAQLDHELVPLPVAATVAYFHITEAAHQVRTQSDLADVVPLVAIALSTIAPIHADSGPLSSAEVRERLYGKRRPDLDGLAIRRGDLRMAMITLREARAAFGPSR
ncbi:MAG TPA: hypothetical protein VFC18_23155 [Burkholderiales bacterium]|nr:hypothetical protein [Burkholderiales bacterium]